MPGHTKTNEGKGGHTLTAHIMVKSRAHHGQSIDITVQGSVKLLY